jgi:hypothetical protein
MTPKDKNPSSGAGAYEARAETDGIEQAKAANLERLAEGTKTVPSDPALKGQG